MMYKKLAIAVLASSMVLTACGGKETAKPVEPAKTQASETKPASVTHEALVKAYKDMVDELAKGKDGGKIDWEKVEKTYNEQFKKLVQDRDSEYSEKLDQEISSAIKAGKDGAMKSDIVKQVVDKLGQKVFFLTLRHNFKTIEDNISDKAKAKAELDQAKAFYNGVLKSTVEKRDKAYETQMVTAIEGALKDMDAAVEGGKKLEFSLAKQVVDKTLMKTFYLATGGAQGYVYKIENAVKEGKDPKVEQAEGWAFYQSLHGYLVKSAKEDAELIQNKLDLKTATKDIKGDELNKAFVRGFAVVAKNEYEESFKNWGKDKGVITALEGALFIQLIEADAKKLLGEEQTKALLVKADEFLKAAKANDKAKADALYKEIQPSLDKLAKAGK
ncbi:hypothetical protein [Effusibacillus lacus]|uniref:Lipoprotein n=1 Tax=Effusibacillus lacus TaxID=1348429 RepID=A0A292YGX5_9BACL|nr:hypothetical protein [Effusibacillus lacus]TCS74279.1 hypothetical protein EDD64_11416 [Effusibacillus lacus]GAX88738.1 hypothetical protein EFBL_0352 [Effusibacillus lacus]